MCAFSKSPRERYFCRVQMGRLFPLGTAHGRQSPGCPTFACVSSGESTSSQNKEMGGRESGVFEDGHWGVAVT